VKKRVGQDVLEKSLQGTPDANEVGSLWSKSDTRKSVEHWDGENEERQGEAEASGKIWRLSKVGGGGHMQKIILRGDESISRSGYSVPGPHHQWGSERFLRRGPA